MAEGNIALAASGPKRANFSRTRTGCWTCRKRKKKCDSEIFPCNNCVRLRLHCESQMRLVWEDDSRRQGMSRRGPPRLEKINTARTRPERTVRSSPEPQDLPFDAGVPQWPLSLTHLPDNESTLLDNYIQRFSRTYPTCSGPSNPFISIFLPLAMQNPVVLHSLLALSGAQTWTEAGFTMEMTTLKLRQRALAGFRRLLTLSNLAGLDDWSLSVEGHPQEEVVSEADFVRLAASCVLLLLYEKLMGEDEANWLPHLKFMSRLFTAFFRQRTGISTGPILQSLQNPEAFQFIHNLFLYNDLVQATSRGMPTLSDYYLQLEQGPLSTSGRASSDGFSLSNLIPPTASRHNSHLAFPQLMARICAGDENVTDADITAWDGGAHWLPSFSLTVTQWCDSLETVPVGAAYSQLTSYDEERLISDLYRITANIYRIQAARRRGTTDTLPTLDTDILACQAVQLIAQVPDGSPFENALLWPMGIIAKDLTRDSVVERTAIIEKLQVLEQRFHMRHFERARAVFQRMWERMDEGEESWRNQVVADKSLLFG